MQQKNKRNSLFLTFIFTMSIFLLSGCNSGPELSETAETINSNVSIAGMQLGMKEKSVLDLIGANFEKSPCIIGYEYEYSDLNLNLGIDIDKMSVKRITFKNPEYTVYSMQIGIKCTEGAKILSEHGFVNDGESKFKFVKEDIRITMLSMNGETINGFTLEFIS
ncbi:hypothetical protein [Proteocatella sphenisci]|uniref:hypothetical protein n=1 Tax=Proteocatella sphenisci TaxID=181070 RepID=UPI00048E3845|nr:hypothetical protein [Proteocatella sphenisci]